MNCWMAVDRSTTPEPVMPDDHSKVVPLLPIPNRTVKRLSADDSAQLPGVKVGHRQAYYSMKPSAYKAGGFVFFIIL